MNNYKINLFVSLITIIGCVGCSLLEENVENEKSMICGVSDPINELSWLNDQFNSIKNIPESGIILYRYNGKEVIEIQSSLMSSTNLSQYYCDGTKLQFDTPETYKNDYKIFLSDRIMIKVLYGEDLWN